MVPCPLLLPAKQAVSLRWSEWSVCERVEPGSQVDHVQRDAITRYKARKRKVKEGKKEGNRGLDEVEVGDDDGEGEVCSDAVMQ